MSRPTIEYLNARAALKPASGGKTYSRTAEYCPDSQLDLSERTEMQVDSLWSDYRINADAMWSAIFARFGVSRNGFNLAETF
jgi:hypothetical protein